ncbi:MAG: hypothetical protein M1835_003409 [Candelina submexicana]|nr:MAG: hypothetical protein M1835_003409 [Candelina submexicana]
MASQSWDRAPPGYTRPDPIPAVDPQFTSNILECSGDPRYETWKLLVRAISHSALIHRFADKAQTSFTGKPLPDGSNLDTRTFIPGGGVETNGSIPLQQMFGYYREWLTWLHYKELVRLYITKNRRHATTGIDDSRITKQLAVNLVHETRLQENIQATRVVEREGTFDHRGDLTWVYDWRRGVHDGINAMQLASQEAVWQGRDVEDAIHEAWEKIPAEVKVLTVLIDQEEIFENSLRIKHVEDTLIDKRIFILSDKSVAWLTYADAQGLRERYIDEVSEYVAYISKSSRDMYEFRLLRDWGYGRPWKKLYYIIETKEKPTLSDAIRNLTKLFASSKLSNDLIGVHPIDKADLPEEELCVICQSEFESKEMMLNTWCDHKFHPGCIFESWDTEYKFDWICPLCRHSPGELRDRVSFDAEKKDFKGDEDELFAEENRLAYAWHWETDHPDEEIPARFSVAVARNARLTNERDDRERDQRGALPGL